MEQEFRVGPAYAFFGNPNIAAGAGMEFLGYTRGDVTFAPQINISTGRVDQIGTSGLAGSAWSGGIDPMVTLPLIDESKTRLNELVNAGGILSGGGTVAQTTTKASGTGTVTVTGNAGSNIQAGTYKLTVTTGGNTSATRVTLLRPDGSSSTGQSLANLASDNTYGFTVTVGTATVANDVFNTVVTITGAKESFGFGSGFEKLGTLNTLALIPFDELDQGTNGIDAPNGVWLPAAVVTDFGSLTYNLPEATDDAHTVHEVQVRGLRLQFDDRPTTAGGSKTTGTSRILLPRTHRTAFIGSPGSMGAQTSGANTYTAPAWSLPATPDVG